MTPASTPGRCCGTWVRTRPRTGSAISSASRTRVTSANLKSVLPALDHPGYGQAEGPTAGIAHQGTRLEARAVQAGVLDERAVDHVTLMPAHAHLGAPAAVAAGRLIGRARGRGVL